MKKLLLTSFVMLAIAGSSMAQAKKATTKLPSKKGTFQKAQAKTEADKVKQAEAAKTPTVDNSALTVQSEEARKKANKNR
ncbi:hypothetical protein [Ferruginibacter sp. HRS2-29]|uniref:hypothetical protein n=1 Tax=Ferruginibacter sp. HRS2-29 TaxID=2487334 RepID=UPI0020CF4E1D|nr:hypothetical protein [Ferruginibacter sp. HRS2-29]MCP9749437.1 hypothetical protein [Ferruginibacter sp. HRS2-29]